MKRKLVPLKSSKDFDKSKFTKPSYSNSLMRIRVGSLFGQNTARFGFIIPKKSMGKVVDRNLVKRRLKAVLLKNMEHLKTFDVLIFPNKNILKTHFTELEQKTVQLFKKANLWKY